jgi:hypothetical protein
MILKVYDLFDSVTSGPWVETDFVQFKNEDGVLCFQCSNGIVDWIRNFDFPAVPYKRMETEYKVHAGFLEAYQLVRDEINALDFHAIVGYSHGAALALLACEDQAFRGRKVPTFVFGCPRVFYKPPQIVKDRTAHAMRYTSKGDIVTKVPPFYHHVGQEVLLCGKTHREEKSLLSYLSRHSPSVYRQRLLDAGLSAEI